MINTSTVFVIGAGASAELGFPTGAALLNQIAGCLDFDVSRFDGRYSGRGEILNAFGRIEPLAENWNLPEFIKACRRLREAAVLGRSIDNVIDQNDDSKLIEVAGKLAIALCLSEAEAGSVLRKTGGSPWQFAVENLLQTWLYPFSQILTTNVRKSALDRLLNNVTIINFNYDRSVEASLPSILAANYGLSIEEAARICANLSIHHPYGQIGALPEFGHYDGFVYGEAGHDRLHEIVPSLRTFTEQVEEGDELNRIRTAMQTAHRVVFLGFGYHRQNLDLLTPLLPMTAQEVLGTVYKEPFPAVEKIKSELGVMAEYHGFRPSLELSSQTSKDFLFDHFRRIAA